jgi:hypothetical protein
MDDLNIVGAVVSPSPSHPFGLDMCDLKHIFAVRQGYGLDRSDCLAASISRRAKCLNQHCSSHYLFCSPGNFMVYGCRPVHQRPT